MAILLLCVMRSTNSASLQTPLILCFKSAVNSCMGIALPVCTACTYKSRPRSPWKALSYRAVQQALERGCKLRSAWTTLRKVTLLVYAYYWKARQLTETKCRPGQSQTSCLSPHRCSVLCDVVLFVLTYNASATLWCGAGQSHSIC